MPTQRSNLTILGTGFAAFSLIKRIEIRHYDIVVVSPRNHFLFTPLLPSTTVGTIEFRSIIEPIRVARKGIHYYEANCIDIDSKQREISCAATSDGQRFKLQYDRLVIAVGAESNTFGLPGVREHAYFLRQLSDARAIRQRIIECLERASAPGLPEKDRSRLLHFVVVGGGPTGIEFAAEMHDFLRQDLYRWYPDIAREVQITVIEAQDQILGTFHSVLRDYALKLFRRKGIDVRTGTTVTAIEAEQLILTDDSALPSGLIVWSTGNAPTPLVKQLPFAKDRASRLITDDYFNLKGQRNIHAIGDGAIVEGESLPATAQVAQQEGKYLARLLNREARGKAVKPFKYRHLGMLAYIGSQRALADTPGVKGYGFPTWLFWRSAYLTKLVSWKNKTLVLFDWLKTLVFGRDISRF